MDIKYLTPTEIWEDFDPNKDDLEPSIVGTEVEDNIICTQSFFTSETVDQEKVRVYTEMYSDKRWADPRPVIVLLPSILNLDYTTITKNLVAEGHNVLMVDFYGNLENEKHTIFPSSLSFLHEVSNYEEAVQITESAKDSAIYIWTKIARRAISLIQEYKNADSSQICLHGYGMGASIGWIVAAIDKRIKAFCPISGGGYLWSENKPKFLYGNIPATDAERAISMGIGAETYAKMITCPLLFICSGLGNSNDIDRAGDLFSLVSSQSKQLLFSTAPDPQITSTTYAVFQKWLRNAMQGIDTEEITTDINFETEENRLLLKASTNLPVQDIDVYVCYGEAIPRLRCWILIKDIQKLHDDTFIANIPVYNPNELIVAYVNFYYEDDNISSTPIIGTKAVDLGIETSGDATFIKSRILFDDKMDLGNFTAKNKKAVLAANTLEMREGPYGIKGISTKDGHIVFYRNKHELELVDESSLLHIDIYSPKSRDLKISMTGIDGVTKYHTIISLTGGEFWQKITLDAQDFKLSSGKPLTSFKETKAIYIIHAEDIILTNFLWV